MCGVETAMHEVHDVCGKKRNIVRGRSGRGSRGGGRQRLEQDEEVILIMVKSSKARES